MARGTATRLGLGGLRARLLREAGAWIEEAQWRAMVGRFDGSGRIPRKEGVGRLAAERGWMDWTRV